MKTIPYFCKEAALEAYNAEINSKSVRIEISEDYRNNNEMTVNVIWASIGMQKPADACEFAGAIQKAALIAASSPLNGARVIYTK